MRGEHDLESSRRPLVRLCAGLGLAVAMGGVLLPSSGRWTAVPVDAVAWVDGRPVPRAAFAAAIARLGANAGTPDADARREIRERLIDEELLVQRGLALGLHRSDAVIRKTIVAEVIDGVVERAGRTEPSEATLRRHHADNASAFALPARVHVRAIHLRDGGAGPGEAAARATRAADAIAGGLAFEAAAHRFGDEPAVPLPDAPLPPHVLRRYLGPALADGALALGPGEVSAPLRTRSGYTLLRVVSREQLAPRRYEDVADEVAGSYRRSAGDRALTRFLAEARERADIRIENDIGRPAAVSR